MLGFRAAKIHYPTRPLTPGIAMLNQEQINSVFEARIARLEKYFQHQGHDLTKYDGLPEGTYGSVPSSDTEDGVRAPSSA